MKNRIKGIAIILAIVLFVVFAVPKIINLIKYSGDKDDLRGPLITPKEQEAHWNDTPSDIEGWSMLDKVNAGLQPVEGADSDADGLTDKEEIEVYHSDPAKASTAGDLYTDGYKIANNMDVNTYVDYRNDLTFDKNSCSEVSLTAVNATDFGAIVDVIENAAVEGYKVYRAYDVYHFSGEFSVDVSDITSANDVAANDLMVLIGPWHQSKMDKVKTSLSGNTITLDYTFDSAKRYTVVIAKKNGLFGKVPHYKFSLNSSGDMALEDTQFMYIHVCFLLNLIFDNIPFMYYVPTGNAVTDARIESYLLALADDITDHFCKATSEDIKKIDSVKMAGIKGIMSHFTEHEIDSKYDKITPPMYAFLWCDKVIAAESDYKAQVTDIKNNAPTKSSDTGFDINTDAFSFPNFNTEYAQSGNCAGIAYYTAELFNTKTAPSNGSYSSDQYENGAISISWDISNDSENGTLTNPCISDFKDSSFVKNHKSEKGLLSNLSDGEEEFAKMISSYWALTNDHFHLGDYVYYISDSVGVYSWEIVEDMVKSLDKGKILILAMMDNKGYGHAMNVVDYKKSADGNTIYFTLYDNIYPGNSYKGGAIDNTLTVVRTAYEKGDKDSFSYYYKPYDSCNYEYNSENNVNGWKCFVVMDNNFNVFNEAH